MTIGKAKHISSGMYTFANRQFYLVTDFNKHIDKIYDDFKIELEAEYQRGRDSILSRSCENCKFSKLEYECEDERYFCEHPDINFQHYPPYGFSCNKWEQK